MKAIPILIIGIGTGWILNVYGIIPAVDWIWSLLLGLTGLLTLFLGEKNKFTFVIGPFLLVSSVLSVLRQTDILQIKYEVPMLVIVMGILWLIVDLKKLPFPEWLKNE